MQRFFSICLLISVIHHISRLNNENSMIISIDAEKDFDKIQYPLMIKKIKKNSPESGHRGKRHHIIKAIYDKPTVNIKLNGKKLKVFL